MVLNIPARRRTVTEPEPAVAIVDSPPQAEEAPAEPRRRTRRTIARATESPATDTTASSDDAAPADADGGAPAEAERPRARRAPRSRKAADPTPEEPAETHEEIAEAQAAQPVDSPDAAVAPDELPSPDSTVPAEGESEQGRTSRRRGSRGGRGRRGRGDRPEAAAVAPAPPTPEPFVEPAELRAFREEADGRPELRPILRALEQQARQVERLARITEDLARRVERPSANGAAATGSVVPPARTARVGVFVDTANIELATDRLRVRFDWGKVLRFLLKDRQLVRAVAYSPIHDDPAVSIETQRFVEPFLDHGFKVVTKPFRRFQDGSIKANLDIELALDVVAMLDRLDVLVLVSGDGDFQRLVELAQSRGVRVEVAAVGASTASNLRHAADEYVDLGARARDLRA